MIVSYTVLCKADIQVAPVAVSANTATDSDAAVADAAVDNFAATDASVTDAAHDAAAPDAPPDHVCTALRKALNACARDRNVYRILRSDFFPTLEYRERKTQMSRMLKLRACLKAKL